jgi:hypothetical protein
MAKLMLIGTVAEVEITRDPLDGDLTAACVKHGVIKNQNGCPWTETYDDLGDAVEYASDHADGHR